MYADFSPEQVRAVLGLEPSDDPVGLVLHGVYNVPRQVGRWLELLPEAHVARNVYNLVAGRWGGQPVWYSAVLGGPQAAFILHSACLLGVQRIVLIGSYGGLRPEQRVGDLLVVSEAGRGDGASDWYLPPGAPAQADPQLTALVGALLTERSERYTAGRLFTTSAFMAETEALIASWSQQGYAGVDMEAATTLAVAQALGARATGLVYLYDHIIVGHTLLQHTPEERAIIEARRALIGQVALDALVAPL
jgi:uridine phosphorylase